jgi:pyridoxal phosphate enzyme (YggS family)
MLPEYEEFRARADAVRARIARACALAGRSPDGVQLLAVTKSHPAGAVEMAARYGLRAVGESRVHEAAEKRALAKADVAWELIGHLQSNKARLAARLFDRIQSVDSAKLLGILDREAGELGRTLGILLEVNAGLDPAKSGVEPGDAPRLLEAALGHRNLRVEGLMTVAPFEGGPDAARRAFARLRDLRDGLAAASGAVLGELSMGMTGDLDEAVAEGSTIVRVGTALFGARS